jgi:hypothetical protein
MGSASADLNLVHTLCADLNLVHTRRKVGSHTPGGKWGLTHPEEIAALGDFREDTRPMCEHDPSSHLEEIAAVGDFREG